MEHKPGQPGRRPGDDFNQRETWKNLLEAAGWTFVYSREGADYWRRPGKTAGVSACTGWQGKDYFFCWSSSTEFKTETPYDKFAFYATLHHGGDFKTATKALAALGFGEPRSREAPQPEPPAREQPSAEACQDDPKPTYTLECLLERAKAITLKTCSTLIVDLAATALSKTEQNAVLAAIKETLGKPATLDALRADLEDAQHQHRRTTQSIPTAPLVDTAGKPVPHSTAADLLASQNLNLAYDHVKGRWLRYAAGQWQEITDILAARTIETHLDAGLGGQGYYLSYRYGVTDCLRTRLATAGFDADLQLVPFTNGVLNLSSGELLPHSPDLKLTWRLPFAYNPLATCEPVQAWLLESVNEDPLQVELLRAYIKAIITGRADLQRFLALIGTGSTGKGSFLRLCTALVGECNVHVTELKLLENNRFETARIYRKRLVVVTDAEKYSGDVSILKALTGEDSIRFEEKHRQGGENFRFRGMVLIAANEEIATSDHTAGLQRRRITMRFDHQVPPGQRRDLEREFKPCLPGVVAWALALSDDRVKQLLVETDQYVPNVGKFTLKTLQATNPLV